MDGTDWEWVQRVQNGETDAFEILIQRHQKPIFNLLYRWLGDREEASDAAQEVFLAAYRAIREFRGDALFSTWLYRIAVNQAINRRKRLGVDQARRAALDPIDSAEAPDPLADLPHPGPNPAQEAERKETHARIQEGLNGLKEEEALIILLHDLQEVPYEEIARILKLPLGTVKSRLHRARLALKAKLADYFDVGARADKG
ncbi:MAG: sigma-70 family RNA polymerase sigma factor [Candidatus Manganitrophaceae bacterium]|nr:MAG: sigma-70 family RNA polymerase sigma factor [Candidatus Manganitrophaceae bacterium]